MENHKSQIPNLKQISITETTNSKREMSEVLLFGSLEFCIWLLFACPVGSMRPYQGYLVLGIWYLCRLHWLFADRRTAKFLMRLEDGNVKR